jgi:uncharacterized protein YicC (UPF0701 family)
MAATKARTMSAEHKQALATGRSQSRAVKDYLVALKNNKPKRGRKRTVDSITARLDKIADELATADALQDLLLLQEQADLERELTTLNNEVDLSGLEKEFVKVALGYANSKGIDYATWRKFGVSAETLAKAGIKR